MRHLYSIAICPPDARVASISQMKKELQKRIGRFGNVNSDAHVTFNIFLADDAELAEWKKYLSRFCISLNPVDLMFNATKVFTASGTFFLAPDTVSNAEIAKQLKRFHKGTSLQSEAKSFIPHLSVARKLTSRQLKIAHSIWDETKIEVGFRWDNLAIRKFDE
jgi:2'-5' RNA ligase